MKDPATIIAEEIDRKEGREIPGRMLPLEKRKHVFALLSAAQSDVSGAIDTLNGEDSTIDAIIDDIKFAADTLKEASDLLVEQAEQLR